MLTYILKSGNLYLSKTGGLTNDPAEALVIDGDAYEAISALPGYQLRFVRRCEVSEPFGDVARNAAYTRIMREWVNRA